MTSNLSWRLTFVFIHFMNFVCPFPRPVTLLNPCHPTFCWFFFYYPRPLISLLFYIALDLTQLMSWQLYIVRVLYLHLVCFHFLIIIDLMSVCPFVHLSICPFVRLLFILIFLMFLFALSFVSITLLQQLSLHLLRFFHFIFVSQDVSSSSARVTRPPLSVYSFSLVSQLIPSFF